MIELHGCGLKGCRLPIDHVGHAPTGFDDIQALVTADLVSRYKDAMERNFAETEGLDMVRFEALIASGKSTTEAVDILWAEACANAKPMEGFLSWRT